MFNIESDELLQRTSVAIDCAFQFLAIGYLHI